MSTFRIKSSHPYLSPVPMVSEQPKKTIDDLLRIDDDDEDYVPERNVNKTFNAQAERLKNIVNPPRTGSDNKTLVIRSCHRAQEDFL